MVCDIPGTGDGAFGGAVVMEKSKASSPEPPLFVASNKTKQGIIRALFSIQKIPDFF